MVLQNFRVGDVGVLNRRKVKKRKMDKEKSFKNYVKTEIFFNVAIFKRNSGSEK